MNKTILTGASLIALAIAAPAFAQSTSTVGQTGNNNNASVAQNGGNASAVDQAGNGNGATVTQGS